MAGRTSTDFLSATKPRKREWERKRKKEKEKYQKISAMMNMRAH